MKILVFTLLILITVQIKAQKIQSPDEFLGYAIGTKYTRHHKIVDYFDYVAKNASNNVKFSTYGTTNEGRSLNVAFISNKENILNLEAIKNANLQRAKLQNGIANNEVAIVWLSYNVHGNEPSSSEAAMQTLYKLVTEQTNGWLKNTVVIIDPCLNPDGRDRYVNWFNNMVGDYTNANPISREHSEPWPGGRVNHYHFDLNRDWAWQTQVETQQRIKLYNQWMPQVHVDFHEQGFNEPYYFAPAAEPMHEVITPWQRDFQTTIGKNNAKYFDEKGWYYFTKERFDLFYPSYGDTYPTYNGSIGMTYEQGGHSRGGLTVQMDNGDTLTLVDRVNHHFTTSMSTIEITSIHVKKVLENFSTYFNNSINAIGSNYKSYVLTANSKTKLQSLKKLLLNNGIEFTDISKVAGNGLNYFTNKEEAIVLQKYSIAVSAYQPKSLLAKVLLEPKSKLSDTATYDITAWSAPYAYGIQAYASTTKLITENSIPTLFTQQNLPNTNYAYYIPYKSLNDAKVMSKLISNKVKIYINEKEIVTKGQTFAKGTIMIPKVANIKIWKTVTNILENADVEVVAIESGFVDKGPDMGSPDNKFISAPRIACVTGDGNNANASGEIWHFYDREINYPITMLNVEDIRLRNLKNIDVLIFADGYYDSFDNKIKSEEIKTWVKMGGRLIVMEGAANQLAKADWGNKIKKEDTEKKKEDNNDVLKYENRERAAIVDYIPGAIYEVNLDNSHPLAFGFDKIYYTLKQNSDVLEYSSDAWNIGIIKKNKVVSGFAGANVLQKIKDGTVLSVQEMGSGSIIYFIDNPIFRNFWENGKLLFFNAAFLVGNNAVRL